MQPRDEGGGNVRRLKGANRRDLIEVKDSWSRLRHALPERADNGVACAGVREMRIALFVALLGVCAATAARAGDVETGRRLAESRCAPCHIVARDARNE